LGVAAPRMPRLAACRQRSGGSIVGVGRVPF
jgi:hypothetical protein